MRKLLIYCCLLIALAIYISGCKKEISLESGAGLGDAVGVLTDSLGNCKNADVRGEYNINEDLSDSNFVKIYVNFSSIGKYLIYTDTINGMWFLDSGYAQNTGATIITLRGRGRPEIAGTADYNLKFGSSRCMFSVTAGGPNNGSSSLDYLPTNSYGWIRYSLSPAFDLGGGVTLDTFRATISPSTIAPAISNRTYYQYNTTPTNDVALFTKGIDGQYWSVGTPEFDYLYVYDSIVNNENIEYYYLVDNPAATPWETAILRAGIYDPSTGNWLFGGARLRLRILGTNLSGTFNGIQLNNIIKVERKMLFVPESGPNTGAELTLLVGNISYAKGIGMVEQVVFDPNSNPANKIIQTITIKGFKGL